MTPRELIDTFREETRDTAEPYLWSDREILRYLNEAQRMFCRLTWGIADSRSRVCRISYARGEREVPFDPRILKIRELRRGDGKRVTIENIETLDVRHDEEGAPHTVVVDIDMNMMSLYPLPHEDGELHLMVNRLPLQDMAEGHTDPEINEQHHFSLLL